MHHPFESLSPEWRKKLFWAACAASLIIIAVFGVIGAPLNTPAAPSGVVSYELAGSVSQAQAMLDSWDQTARLYAAFGLGFDYLFMLAYSTAIGLACLMAGDALRRRGWPLAQAGRLLAWGLWLAAILDGIENVALSVILLVAVASPWPELARWCATFKFGLIFLGLVYAFLGLAVNLVGRLNPGKI
jgi:hypothetical protein